MSSGKEFWHPDMPQAHFLPLPVRSYTAYGYPAVKYQDCIFYIVTQLHVRLLRLPPLQYPFRFPESFSKTCLPVYHRQLLLLSYFSLFSGQFCRKTAVKKSRTVSHLPAGISAFGMWIKMRYPFSVRISIVPPNVSTRWRILVIPIPVPSPGCTHLPLS